MSTTLDDLLAQPDLGLRELHRAAATARPISWVSSSDLADPTPFLVPEQLLLTTGRQFADDAPPEEYRAYVDTLLRREVLGVGFGTEVLRAGTPSGLVEACRDAGMPLVEVPYRTPFLALIRHVARAQERAARRRDDWAAATSRAISGAALSRGDVGAVLRELATRLDARVLLFDADGGLERSFPRGGSAPTGLDGDVRRLLAAGTRSADERVDGEATTTLQTIGPSGELAGVLSVTGPRPDRAMRAVLATAVALVEVEVAESRRAARASLARNAVVLRLLRESRPGLAAEVAAPAGPELPSGAAAVLVAGPDPAEGVRALADREARTPEHLVALEDGRLVAVVPERAGAAMAERWASWGHAVGLARLDDLAAVDVAVARATAARERAGAGAVADWDELPPPRDLGAAAALAAARLAPIVATPEGTVQLAAASAWFAANCAWGPAARALGLHPHTVRDRVEALARALDLDLAGFAGRALLWATISEADPPRDTAVRRSRSMDDSSNLD